MNIIKESLGLVVTLSISMATVWLVLVFLIKDEPLLYLKNLFVRG